ncbi:MAG TPA: hypothetical protein VGD67_03515 [Pseudonocardiaceae bacterium]
MAATAAGGPPTAAIGVSATAAANAAAAGTGVADPGVAATPVPPYTTQIVRTQQWRRTMGGVEYQFSQFENRAYRCGRTGVFTFLLLERAGEPNRSAPLWVRLHGGGVGYYLPDGTYLGGEAHNDQESADFLAGVVLRDIGEDAGKNTIVGRRLREGARVLATAMCDHDVRSGLGTPYPNNPHHADTVAGALADMAAIDAVANGATGIARRPTTQIFLVGGSAGAIGAWSVAHNLNARGVRLTGAIGDAGVFATRSTVLHDRRLTPQTRDPRWRWQDQAVKIGPYATQPALAPERVLPAGFPVPFLDVYMDQDPHCAGQHPVVPEAVADGYANNCRWVHGAVSEAVASPRQRSIGYPGPGHTITTIEGHPVQADAEAWYRAVMASSPGPVIW